MIHKIVEKAHEELKQYQIPIKDQLEIMYCYGRIDASLGEIKAYETLTNHLEKHYEKSKPLQTQ